MHENIKYLICGISLVMLAYNFAYSLDMDLRENNSKLYVATVFPGSYVDFIDIKKNDIIISVENNPVTTMKELEKIYDSQIKKHGLSKQFDITLLRDGNIIKRKYCEIDSFQYSIKSTRMYMNPNIVEVSVKIKGKRGLILQTSGILFSTKQDDDHFYRLIMKDIFYDYANYTYLKDGVMKTKNYYPKASLLSYLNLTYDLEKYYDKSEDYIRSYCININTGEIIERHYGLEVKVKIASNSEIKHCF